MKLRVLVGLIATVERAVCDEYNFGQMLYEPPNPSSSSEAQSRSEWISDWHSKRSPHEIRELFRAYLEQHSVSALRSESDEQLCRRNFVINWAFRVSCHNMGNSLGSVLNNAIYAVALNRTYLASHIDMDESCHGYLSLSPWVPTADEIRIRLANTECPLPSVILGYDGSPMHGYSASSYRIVSEDNLYNCLPVHLRSDPTLLPFVRDRSELLFGANENGRFEPYGMLSSLMFNFSMDIHTSIEACSRHVSKNALTIGIHLRHKVGKTHSERVEFINRGLKILHEIRDANKVDQCVVYLATNRNETIDTVISYANAISCSVVSVARFLKENPFPQLPREHSFHNANEFYREEQGPWAHGLVQLADVLLLSNARYFIGSGESTFSWIMANNLAARNMDEGFDGKYLYWVK